MSWKKNYPLPPLPLGAIMQDYATFRDDVLLENITVLRIEEGNGTHVCDDKCGDRCSSDCANSDWIVTLRYDPNRDWEAEYGVYRGEFSLWAD